MTPLRSFAARSSAAFALFVLGALVLGFSSAGAARPAVESLSFTERSDGQGYVIRVHTSGEVPAYTEPRLLSDGRLEWTLFNTGAAASFKEAAAYGPVRAYTAEAEGSHLVLRFELRDGVHVEASAYRDRASSDLLLGLTYTGDVPTGDAPSDLPVPVASAEPSPETPPSRRGTTAGERWRLNTIVIDAGHGGKDPGASYHGLREKDLTLAIARKLGHYVETKLGGIDVVYTRDDDRFITLANRGHIANKAGGKLFVSIHVNAAGNRSAKGTETYFLGTHKSAAASKVMDRENSVVRLEENPEQYEDLDEQALIMQALAQSAYMRQSEQLAGLVQRQFKERVGRKSRGVKQAGFYVLWGASMPAILVETGFVTNREEANFLGSEKGQDYLASALFRAVRDFKAEYEKGLSLAAGE